MFQVKMFDCEHENDLEKEMNQFLEKIDEDKVVKVNYSVAALADRVNDQIYCFSAMILYRN